MKTRLLFLTLLIVPALLFAGTWLDPDYGDAVPLFKSCTTLAQITAKVAKLFPYRADVGDYWQSPLETYRRGCGDCEDLAIYVAYQARWVLNIQVEVVYAELKDGNGHILVRYEGVLYDPVGQIDDIASIIHVYCYGQAIAIATNCGVK